MAGEMVERIERTYWERLSLYDNGTIPTVGSFFEERDLALLRVMSGVSEDEERGSSEIVLEMAGLASALLKGDATEFERLLEQDLGRTYENYQNEYFCALVLLGLFFGVASGNGACANYLGALYYLGQVVDVDYVRAKALYEIAENCGIIQAIINLGYIYEYGRVDEPNHLAAYMQYAKACALCESFEALYKLGDMYSQGAAVAQDIRTAFALYNRSLRFAEDEAQRAQPAIRIAQLISDPRNSAFGIPYDPMGALRLYQLAECGLRIDIAQGQLYYRRRLQEAIEGQARIRAILDEPQG